jgi:hypothetical protein
MPEHKHTKGKAIVKRSKKIPQFSVEIEGNQTDIALVNIICNYPAYSEIAEDQAEANSNLIAEAFNVTNETGKTPRELVEENEHLEEKISEDRARYIEYQKDYVAQLSAMKAENEKMRDFLQDAIDSFYGDASRPSFRRAFPDHKIVKAENFLASAQTNNKTGE